MATGTMKMMSEPQRKEVRNHCAHREDSNMINFMAGVFLTIIAQHAVALKPRTFQFHDKVDMQAAKTSPFNNPSETYSYYALPFCPPKNYERKSHR